MKDWSCQWFTDPADVAPESAFLARTLAVLHRRPEPGRWRNARDRADCTGNTEQKRWLPKALARRRVVLAFDPDPAGDKAAAE
jgi:hypothetical protein